MSDENISTVNNATVNDDRHDDIESARSPSSASTYSTAANCSSRDSTSLSFSSPQGGSDQHSSIRATRSDPAATASQNQSHITHSNSQKELSNSASSRQSETPAEAEDFQSKERRARWIRDKMSNYPNQTDNLSGYNRSRVNNLPHDDAEKATGEEVHHCKHNPLLENHYRHLYKQYQNAQQDFSGGFRELPQKTGIDSSEGSNWISENDSKGSRFHRPYSLREQRSWKSAAEASSTPGFGSASTDINRTIVDESNKQRVRAGLPLPVEKSKRFQDFLENELVDPRQEEDDEQEDPEEEDDEIGQITDPSSYYLTRHKRLAYPYPRKSRNPSSDNSDANDLSRNVGDSRVIVGAHLDRSPSECSISSESDSQGDCENALDPPRLTLTNEGGGGYFVGGGSATNGRKLSVLFASHDVWSEESIIQSFKELGPTATSLFEAAWGGKLLELEEILKDEEIVKKLKESEIRDGSLRTPLHLSAACGHVACVELLLSKGAEVNVYDGNKATPLACAASCGSVEVIQVLLNHGANVNAGFEEGKTALSWSVLAGSVESAKKLLEAGAKQNPPQVYLETPLHICSQMGDPVILQLLLEHGADVNLCKGTNKTTALILACEEGNVSCVRLLLKAGASHAAKDMRGHTALHVAATCDADTVLTLLKAGADPNALNADGRSVLHCAISRGSRAAECVRLLVEHGADIDAQDNYGYTPLHLAAVNESSQCAAILLHHGSNVTLKTKAGTNALSLLVRRIPDVMRYLVERLDSAVTIHDHDPADPDCEIRLDFRAIVPNCEKRVANNVKQNGFMGGENSSSSGGSGVVKRGGGGGGRVDNKGDVYFQKPHKETEFLTCLVAAGNKKILAHPLSEAFLTLKWRRVRKFFWASLLFQIALVALFTIYVVEIYLIRCPYHRDPHDEHPSAEPFHNEAGIVNEGIEIITPAPPVPPQPPDVYPMMLPSSANDTENPSSLPVSPSNYNSTSRSKRAADPVPIPDANGFQWFSVTPKKNKTRKRTFRRRKNESLSLEGTETRNWKQRRPAAAPTSEGVLHEKLGRTRSEEGAPSNFEYTHTAAEAPGNDHEEPEDRTTRMEPIRCRLTPTLHIIWILLVSFASLLALKEIFQLIQSPISYVTSSENWGQWLLISSVTLTAWNTPNQVFHLEYWQYPAAACGIFLAWGLMLLQVGRFPSLGLYVQMLGKVAANFGLFILAYACLLIAFALSFCVLFPESPPYSSVAVSILKVFTMMVGEVDYEDLFYNEQRIHDPILFPITAHLLYGAFVIIVTIVLMNLLVGLAVHDIQGLQKGAKLNKLSRQTALVSRLESFIFSKKLQKILPRTLGSLLQRSAMLVPSSYNWSYYFRPNDPRDKRLPKDIKQASLRLAASRHSSNKTKSHRVHSQTSNHQSHQPVETKPLATPRPVSSTSHHANVVHHHHHADASIRRVEQRLDHLQNQLEMVLATINGRMDSVLGALQEQNDTRSRLRLSFERSNSDNNFDVFQPEEIQTTDRSLSICTSPTPSPGVNWRKPTFPNSPSVLKDVSTEKG